MSEMSAKAPEIEEKIESKKMQKGMCGCGVIVGLKGQPVVFSAISRGQGQCVACHIAQWGNPRAKMGRTSR